MVIIILFSESHRVKTRKKIVTPSHNDFYTLLHIFTQDIFGSE